MAQKPPRPYRANSGCTPVVLKDVVGELFELLDFVRSDGPGYGEPGSYSGSARSGGSAYQFAVTYLASQIMSKFDDGDKAADERKTLGALAKFREAEALCTETNVRFAKYFYGHRPENPDIARVILRAREKIWRLMGKLDLNLLAKGFTFTSGGSVKLPRRKGSSVHKYSSALETTGTTELALRSLLTTIPSWERLLSEGPGLVHVLGNKLTCVPKNYEVHRIIAGEPTGLMYVQKGIHTYLRGRLKRYGVDLSNQEMNQDFARFASATDSLATVDMSTASDTVAKMVVEWFWPEEWYDLMNQFRSPFGTSASGERFLYRKFSSMGNAFTFEVESSLFWALATSCCEVCGEDRSFVGVYGDDVVIPSRAAPLFLESLRECGFKPNEKKTFISGPFRESCGKHYFHGEDVSPFYIRKPVRTLADLFLFANNCERWRRRILQLSDVPSHFDDRLRAFIVKLREHAPSSWRRPRIPDGYGDGAFIGTFDECLPSRPHGKRKWWEGWQVEVLTESTEHAIGITFDTNGLPRPIIASKGKRRVGKPDKSLTDVSLEGFLLSKLERAERAGGPRWHEVYSRVRDVRLLAGLAKDIRENVDSGVRTSTPAKWDVTTIIVPQF